MPFFWFRRSSFGRVTCIGSLCSNGHRDLPEVSVLHRDGTCGPRSRSPESPPPRPPGPGNPQATTAPLPRSHGLRASPPLGPGAPVQERKVTRECSETVVQEHTATALTSRAELCGAVKRRSARRRRQAILNDTFTRSVHPIHRSPGNGLLPSHSVASLARCSCGG